MQTTLVAAGAAVGDPPPAPSPRLADGPASDRGPDRLDDRAAEPPRVRRAPRRRDRARRPYGSAVRAGPRRARPLQGPERPVRPRGGRRRARVGRAAALTRITVDRHTRPRRRRGVRPCCRGRAPRRRSTWPSGCGRRSPWSARPTAPRSRCRSAWSSGRPRCPPLVAAPRGPGPLCREGVGPGPDGRVPGGRPSRSPWPELSRRYLARATSTPECLRTALANRSSAVRRVGGPLRERLGEREIRGVVSREVVSQLPDARREHVVGVSLERQIEQVDRPRPAREPPDDSPALTMRRSALNTSTSIRCGALIA